MKTFRIFLGILVGLGIVALGCWNAYNISNVESLIQPVPQDFAALRGLFPIISVLMSLAIGAWVARFIIKKDSV